MRHAYEPGGPKYVAALEMGLIMVAVVLLAIVAGIGVVTLIAGPGPLGVRLGISFLIIVVAGSAGIAVVLHGHGYRSRIDAKQRKLDVDLKDPKGPPSKSRE